MLSLRRRTLTAATLACLVILASCSSDGSTVDSAASTSPSSSAATTEPVDTTEAPTTTASPTTTVAPTTTVGFTHPVAGGNGFALTKGTWTIDGAVPYEITVAADWGVLTNTPSPQMLGVGRDFGATFFFVSADVFTGAPEQLVANPCVNGGAATMQPATPTTLFGQPAFEAVGVVTQDCPLGGGMTATASADPFIIIATEVNGHAMSIIGGYPASSDGSFVDEFHSTAASLTAIG